MTNIDEIKREHFAEISNRDVIMILCGDYGWYVESWSKDSVAPITEYDTKEEAAARALQLMGLTDPVTPQDWPENIGIGPGPPPKPTPKII